MFLSKIFLYINKLTLKEKENETSLINSNLIKLSFFLGKWFYYRQINKFLDQNFDAYYGSLKRHINLNMSHRDIYVNNLKNIKNINQIFTKNLTSYYKQNFRSHLKQYLINI